MALSHHQGMMSLFLARFFLTGQSRVKKFALCPALVGAGTGAGVDMGTKENVGTNSMALTFNEVSFDVACQIAFEASSCWSPLAGGLSMLLSKIRFGKEIQWSAKRGRQMNRCDERWSKTLIEKKKNEEKREEKEDSLLGDDWKMFGSNKISLHHFPLLWFHKRHFSSSSLSWHLHIT